MRKTLLFLLTFLAVLVCLQAHAEVYTVNTVPNPKAQGQDYYLSNPDSVIDGPFESYVNSLCRLADEKSEAEVCVVLINRFDEGQWDAYNFALDLFNYWGIGKAGNNSGVLVFLAKDSRDIQIITGGGVEGLLPDAVCSEIWHNAADEYLSEGNYNEGVPYIVYNIVKILVSDEAQAELLLGWKPKDASVHESTAYYFILGFVLLIILALFGYKRLQGKPGQNKLAIQQQAASTQTVTGCLSWIFPIPMLFFYLYYRYARKNIKPIPLCCSNCGKQMTLIEGRDRLQYLPPLQVAEDRIGSKVFDVWQCPSCQNIKVTDYEGPKAGMYELCPTCGAKAFQTTDRETLQHATYTSTGRRRDTKKCAVCGFVGTAFVTLPMLVRSTSSSYGGGGGGYRSSGGGGGNWGGGRSFGGGAGGKF